MAYLVPGASAAAAGQWELGLRVSSKSGNLHLGRLLFQRPNMNMSNTKTRSINKMMSFGCCYNGGAGRLFPVVRAAEKSGDMSGGSSSAEATRDSKWLKLLPDKKSALYSHSLPCIEAWLRSLGFSQAAQERASWVIQRPDWHAQLSLDITELRIRYLKSGPGNLERDVERKFSYALCREDLENAILGGP